MLGGRVGHGDRVPRHPPSGGSRQVAGGGRPWPDPPYVGLA